MNATETLLHSKTLPANQPGFFPYPKAPDAHASPNYRATINNQPVDVHCMSGFSGGDVSWLSFDLREPVIVAVTAMRNVETVDVRPASAGFVAKLEGNTATLVINKPCRLFLKWDDCFDLPFHIFANAFEHNIPEPDAAGVHYFGPGIHWPGEIQLKSNETLYIAPGATVYGSVHAHNAQHLSIRGRGTLCASHLDRRSKETYQVNGAPHDMLSFQECTKVSIEGITILDSHHWTVVFRNCDGVHAANIKMFNERNFSTDGFIPVNCRDVLIEDCFARTKDDCVTIKGLDKQYPGDAAPIRNIVVQNCIFWSDNNNGVVVGSETKARTISDIVFRNIDFLRVSNTCGDEAGAMAIICLHDTEMRDIRFEDIRIEHCAGPYFNFFYCDSIFRIPGSRQPGGGTLKNIVLKNISVTGGPFRASYIRGFDERRTIENVAIENVNIHGRLITSAEEGKIKIGPHTRNVRISTQDQGLEQIRSDEV